MADFSFRAPSLFDPTATAAGAGTEYHDAPGAGEQLARLKPCAQWLKDQLVSRGVLALGPETDEGGWMISVPAPDGFALVMLDVGAGQGEPFQVLVTPIGSAERQAARAKAALRTALERSPLVSDLIVTD